MTVAAASLSDRAIAPLRKSPQRSRLGNGAALPRGIDGRSAVARRFKEVLAGIIRDLSPDGSQALTEAQRLLCRRAAMLAVEAEKIEAMIVSGGAAIDLNGYGVLCDRLGRTLARLGIKDRPMRSEPTLAEILDAEPDDSLEGQP